MDQETIRAHLKGSAKEKKRCEELLTALLSAFASGGREGVTRELEQRLSALEGAFTSKIKELEEKF